MKKVLLSLLAVAALVLSCQNYDDEFAALNTKIAGLESQITSLAELRTAVTGVQSSISALQSAVAAAQAAAEAADNSDAITALATSVAAIAADLVDLQAAIDGATTEADLDALKAELNATLAALQALIESNSASIASLITANTDLKAALDELGVDVDSVLSANATFEGNLTITNASELAYAKSLGVKVKTIKGDVYVKVDPAKHTSGSSSSSISAADVNSVTSQMLYVVGNVKISTDLSGGIIAGTESVDLSALTSVTGDYSVSGFDVKDDALTSVGGDVYFDYDGPYVSNLETVGNIYLVAKGIAAASSTSKAMIGTTSIDFLALKKANGVQTVSGNEITTHTSGASLTFGSSEADGLIELVSGTTTNATTSVKIGQAPVNKVSSGAKLTTVELHYAADYSSTNTTGSSALPSLTITATGLTSAVVKAMTITGNVTISTKSATATAGTATIDLSLTETIGGKLSSDAGTNTLTKLKTVGGLSLSEQLAVSLPELVTSASALNTAATALTKDGDLSFAKATSISAPKLSVVGQARTSTKPELRADISAPALVGAVSLPSLTHAGDLTLTAATSFSAPLADVRSVDLASSATSLEVSAVTLATTGVAGTDINGSSNLLGTFEVGVKDLATLTTLKLNNQHSLSYDLNVLQQPALYGTSFPLTSLGKRTLSVSPIAFNAAVELVSLTFKGYKESNAAADVDFQLNANTNVDLTTLVLGGNLDKVIVDTTSAGVIAQKDETKLGSITTSGSIIDITVQDNFDLTSLTLGHLADNVSTTAPIIKVNNNAKLGSFSTTVSVIGELEVIDNKSLNSFNLSSINAVAANQSLGGSIKVHIYGNNLKPTLDAALTGVATSATATTDGSSTSWYGLDGTYSPVSAGSSRSYGQSSLATLSNLISAIETKYVDSTPTSGDYPTLDFILHYKYQTVVSAGSSPVVGDVLISGPDRTIKTDGVTGASVVPQIDVETNASADNIKMLAELKLIK